MKIFDALTYLNKPSSAQLGLLPITLLYSGNNNFWPTAPVDSNGLYTFTEPNLSALTTLCSGATTPIILDIENQGNAYYSDWTATWLPAFQQVVNTAKAATSQPVSVFVPMPLPDRDQIMARPGSSWYITVQNQNNLYAPLASLCDFMCPSLYAQSTDRSRWQLWARNMIDESRRISGKPVYPFIANYYQIAPTYLSLERGFYAQMLNLVRGYADGVILFGGWQVTAETWDPTQDWWRSVKEMM